MTNTLRPHTLALCLLAAFVLLPLGGCKRLFSDPLPLPQSWSTEYPGGGKYNYKVAAVARDSANDGFLVLIRGKYLRTPPPGEAAPPAGNGGTLIPYTPTDGGPRLAPQRPDAARRNGTTQWTTDWRGERHSFAVQDAFIDGRPVEVPGDAVFGLQPSPDGRFVAVIVAKGPLKKKRVSNSPGLLGGRSSRIETVAGGDVGVAIYDRASGKRLSAVVDVLPAEHVAEEPDESRLELSFSLTWADDGSAVAFASAYSPSVTLIATDTLAPPVDLRTPPTGPNGPPGTRIRFGPAEDCFLSETLFRSKELPGEDRRPFRLMVPVLIDAVPPEGRSLALFVRLVLDDGSIIERTHVYTATSSRSLLVISELRGLELAGTRTVPIIDELVLYARVGDAWAEVDRAKSIAPTPHPSTVRAKLDPESKAYATSHMPSSPFYRAVVYAMTYTEISRNLTSEEWLRYPPAMRPAPAPIPPPPTGSPAVPAPAPAPRTAP